MDKTGLVITIKNRFDHTWQTFRDLMISNLPEGLVLVLVDDGSDDDTAQLVQNFPFGWQISKAVIRHHVSRGVAPSLREGWDMCVDMGCKILINLDNDVRLKYFWHVRLMDLHKAFPDNIVSGFNTSSHKVVEDHKNFVAKHDIGGINMCMSDELYMSTVRDCLQSNNWDWAVCQKMNFLHRYFICTKPSVVQHAGVKEGMHMKPGVDVPDIAEDY